MDMNDRASIAWQDAAQAAHRHFTAETTEAREAFAWMDAARDSASMADAVTAAMDTLTPAGGVDTFTAYRAMLSGGGPSSWLHVHVDADGAVQEVIWEGSHGGHAFFEPVHDRHPLWRHAWWIAARERGECSRHGGKWGDDATCATCTDANGNARVYP